MAPSYTPDERKLLLDAARASIARGLTHRAPRPVNPDDFPAPLRELRAAFVTLKLEGELRGCIGSLEARYPLITDVSVNAYNAAFADPRFGPVTPTEAARLHVHISVLTPSQPMTFTHEADLIGQLTPGVDGLVLEASGRRGTFLPAVWETIPDPAMFLANLKLKAGLDVDYWSEDVKVSRYGTEDVE